MWIEIPSQKHYTGMLFYNDNGGIPSNTQTQQSVPQLRYTPDTMQALPIIPQV
jgi:hypothetical protein